MENCYHAQGPSWVHHQYQTTAAAVSNESSSFQVPWSHDSSNSNTPFQFCGGFQPSWSSTADQGLAEQDRAASASKSHSQAEKRRRDRINAQLATLRKLIPMSDKVISSSFSLTQTPKFLHTTVVYSPSSISSYIQDSYMYVTDSVIERGCIHRLHAIIS